MSCPSIKLEQDKVRLIKKKKNQYKIRNFKFRIYTYYKSIRADYISD